MHNAREMTWGFFVRSFLLIIFTFIGTQFPNWSISKIQIGAYSIQYVIWVAIMACMSKKDYARSQNLRVLSLAWEIWIFYILGVGVTWFWDHAIDPAIAYVRWQRWRKLPEATGCLHEGPLRCFCQDHKISNGRFTA
ncbi:MAG TPA: hypothetical protein VFQ60_04595 [Patescibacteria group bacterium]|nr:hypothetical protein [Patescibacteria group bacterium]